MFQDTIRNGWKALQTEAYKLPLERLVDIIIYTFTDDEKTLSNICLGLGEKNV